MPSDGHYMLSLGASPSSHRPAVYRAFRDAQDLPTPCHASDNPKLEPEPSKPGDDIGGALPSCAIPAMGSLSPAPAAPHSRTQRQAKPSLASRGAA
ncbi:hypothetical protein CLCR_09340 [Cladophialophora carrionii]|uniref:Uncharacterized protein n=1 Tax=Cladophialophora carrionii TaxID=86049 RepID=A0A1C1CRM3_9EURO|nr:hypothetical protein CLCR_09340 [Cladophialophora carrionii]